MLWRTKKWTAQYQGRTIEVVNRYSPFTTRAAREILVDGISLKDEMAEGHDVPRMQGQIIAALKSRRITARQALRDTISLTKRGIILKAPFRLGKVKHSLSAHIRPRGLFGFVCLIRVDGKVVGGDIDAFIED